MADQNIPPRAPSGPPVDSGARSSTPLAPVAEKSRIVSIDVLRGVAVLGILGMNIYAFAMPFPAYYNPLLWGGTDTLSKSIWFITHFLFDQKFLPVFSMLFGAGLVLMAERSETGKFAGSWYRRNLWLLVMGALHAYLIWFGDILVTYALLGLLLYPLRRKRAKTLLILGSIWMLPALAASTGASFWMENMIRETQAIETRAEAGEELTEKETKDLELWGEMRPMVAPTAKDLQDDVDAHRGTYTEIVAHRAPNVLMMQTMAVVFMGLWRMGGLMLIGMGLMKLGVFAARKEAAFYRRLLLWGYGLGFSLVAVSASQLAIHDWNFIFFQQRGVHWNYVGSVLVSLGHISLIMLAVKGNWLGSLERPLAAVGRMAFTNYIVHSIIFTTLFYGYGFGLYGSLDRPTMMLLVIPVWAFQLFYSVWWLDRFRYGPIEWLWRLLTYGKVPELRREVSS
jgi:uncharacterized protein